MERITGNVCLDGIKRFQVPDAIVKIKCPKCGDVCDIELVGQIYYPADPSDSQGGHMVAFECENCDLEVGRRVRVVSVVATFDVEDSEITCDYNSKR